MEGIQIDLFSLFVAAILNMIIGFFWYSKWLFGKTWMKLCHLTESNLKGKNSHFFYAFLVSLVIAYFLSFFEAYLGITTVTDGMFVGFCLWLGFVATTQIGGVLWCKESLKLFAINSGCKLVSYLVMAGVIGA
jgi:hypothetical protein